MLSTPDFWVAIAFIGFVALLVYYKVPGMVTRALDERADRIRNELEEAQRMREEAQQLLAEYQRKRRDAEKEAEAIISQAQEEARLMAAETREQISAQIERRLKIAEEKIAQAEVQALDDVRAAAAEAAVQAAGAIISERMTDKMRSDLLAQSIKDVASKLN